MNTSLSQSLIIQKSFGIEPQDVIKANLDDNLSKGLIDKPLYDKAVEQLEQLTKAGKGKGEGSKGGKVIGHTKSGKPIYQNQDVHAAKHFTAEDHRDAARAHEEHSSQLRNKQVNSEREYYANKALVRHHNSQHGLHVQLAHQKHNADHEASLHPDDKKAIAEQKKKQVKDHYDRKQFHNEMAAHIASKYGNSSPGHGREEYERHTQMARHHHNEIDRLEEQGQ